MDVAVHLDHGLTFETVDKALELGFTSVMLDASTLPFEENIARVKAVVEKARKYGATVEAELGLVGGSEDGSCDHGIRCTDPDDAVVYARETGIDALAVGITFAFLDTPILEAITIIGITTMIISIVGVVIGNYFGGKYKHKAELVGGIILVLLGVRILIQHLSGLA